MKEKIALNPFAEEAEHARLLRQGQQIHFNTTEVGDEANGLFVAGIELEVRYQKSAEPGMQAIHEAARLAEQLKNSQTVGRALAMCSSAAESMAVARSIPAYLVDGLDVHKKVKTSQQFERVVSECSELYRAVYPAHGVEPGILALAMLEVPLLDVLTKSLLHSSRSTQLKSWQCIAALLQSSISLLYTRPASNCYDQGAVSRVRVLALQGIACSLHCVEHDVATARRIYNVANRLATRLGGQIYVGRLAVESAQ